MMKLIEILLVFQKLREKPIKVIHQVSVDALMENKRPLENANVARNLHGKSLLHKQSLHFEQLDI